MMRNFQGHFDSLYNLVWPSFTPSAKGFFYNPIFVAFGMISDYFLGRIKSNVRCRTFFCDINPVRKIFPFNPP